MMTPRTRGRPRTITDAAERPARRGPSSRGVGHPTAVLARPDRHPDRVMRDSFIRARRRHERTLLGLAIATLTIPLVIAGESLVGQTSRVWHAIVLQLSVATGVAQ